MQLINNNPIGAMTGDGFRLYEKGEEPKTKFKRRRRLSNDILPLPSTLRPLRNKKRKRKYLVSSEDVLDLPSTL